MTRGAGQSLLAAFDPRANSLNALRLLFATAVLVGHSFAVSGLGEEPHIGSVSLGALAVDGFFVVSGFLITGSRLRSRTLRSYAWRRFLRLYPGLWLNLLLTVAVILPLASRWVGDSVSVGSLAHYAGFNAIWPRQTTIPGALEAAPLAENVNGSLWTLEWEIGGYVVLGLLGTLGLLRRRWLILGALGAWTALAIAQEVELGPLDGWYALNGIRFGLLFLAGSVVWLFQDRLPAHPAVAVAAAALFAISVAVPLENYRILGALPLAYLCVWLGARLPFQRFGVRVGREQGDDISYGVYVYGVPLQQLLFAALGDRSTVPLFIALSIGVTYAVAFASWRLVEAPAMRWGTGLRKRTVAQPEPAVATEAGKEFLFRWVTTQPVDEGETDDARSGS